MWTRAQLKQKAKDALHRNYWKTILVTLIVFVIGGTSSTFTFSNSSDDSDSDVFSEFESIWEENQMGGLIFDQEIEFEENVTVPDLEYSDQYEQDDTSDEYWEGYYDGNFEIIEEDFSWMDSLMTSEVLAFAGIFVVVLILAAIVAAVMIFLMTAFIYNPLEVGTNRFFFKNLNESAEVKEIAYAFDHSYKNVVKILFIRNMCIFGWSLLFVIPGIVKGYEYMMIPYLLAENPSLSKEQAFALSKQMMTGNKWKAFILEWSFIGWDFLSACTLGILSVFYVQPYKCLTYAALYEELSLINGHPAMHQPGVGGYYYQSNMYEQTGTYAQTNPYGQSDTTTYNIPE